MGGAYSEGGAYWKEGAKSNHYGTPVQQCCTNVAKRVQWNPVNTATNGP